jgi:hypothetical protein
MPADVFHRGIDEHPYPLYLLRQISRRLADITAGLRPEDKAHPESEERRVKTEELFHQMDILRFSHTTNLNQFIIHNA